MNAFPDVPVVLVFAGTDPSGGAGIQADIETLASMGCHAATVVTAVTVQDTQNVHRFQAIDPLLIAEQARAILNDMPVSAIKLGMLGSVECVDVLREILLEHPEIPVVLDPILKAGGGATLSGESLKQAMADKLFPLVTVLTPNSLEARQLAVEADNLDACAHELLEFGCEYVLITGSHENSERVCNRLYSDQQLVENFMWERLPGEYHGSGCTLSVAIAGLLAQDLDPVAAVFQAQQYTWETLKHAYRVGMGQLIPNRLFWALDAK